MEERISFLISRKCQENSNNTMDANRLAFSFKFVCETLGIPLELAEQTAAALVASYSEPQRHYHTPNHISHMLEQLAKSPLPSTPSHGHAESQSCSPQRQWNDILHFAIWFHDVIYDPIKGAPFNENASIATWEDFVQQAEPCLVRLTSRKLYREQHRMIFLRIP
jgi:predicted metal-dependent HD superfamily phosphohydrolase